MQGSLLNMSDVAVTDTQQLSYLPRLSIGRVEECEHLVSTVLLEVYGF